MILCLLILSCSRQKEEKKPTGSEAKRVTVQVKIPAKSSGQAAKNGKARETTGREVALAGGRYQAKKIPGDASRKEKTGKTIKEETLEAVNPAESVIRTDLSEKERMAAVQELANLDRATRLEVVMNALEAESPNVRKAALAALADVDDEAVNVALLKAMEDENLGVREKAMEVMEHIESPNILPSLERALSDSDEDIREQALSILEDIPDHRAVDILIEKGLQHHDESIREETLNSLEFITDQRFESYVDAREWWDSNRDEFVFPKVWRIRKSW